MANHSKLSARVRSEAGSTQVKLVRARDGVPAVIYGSNLAPTNLEIPRRAIEVLLSHAAGENILVDIEIDNGSSKANQLAMIQEVQRHPVRADILHVDFHAVAANETIEAHIPIEIVGESDGVKNYGGVLEIIIREILISCVPQNLPEVIEVDITKLKIGQSIHVKDLILPKGVTADLDSELTVLSVVAPKVEAASAENSATSSPEVLKEKKPTT